jgi:glutamate decarboxylase
MGVSRDLASVLLHDFRDAVSHFSRHPVSVPMSKQESSGFNHV